VLIPAEAACQAGAIIRVHLLVTHGRIAWLIFRLLNLRNFMSLGVSMDTELVVGIILIASILAGAVALLARAPNIEFFETHSAHIFRSHQTKVPEITLGFWFLKILTTTLGETAGDSITMNWLKADSSVNDGYLLGSGTLLLVLLSLVAIQISAKRFHPFLFWSAIVASTTAGTAMADFVTRSLGTGYAGGSMILLMVLVGVLGLWLSVKGSISINTVSRPRVEVFFWTAVVVSQTSGAALADWIADSVGLGYEGAGIVFAAGLAITSALYYWTDISRVLLFWVAFILTRPLGATLGDFLDKPLNHGGLALSRPIASLVIATIMIGLILLIPQRAGNHPSGVRPA
jgi:uncharacterized membrane-anchored protein